MIPRKIPLTDRSFAVGDEEDCLEHAQNVHVPHTWSIDGAGHGILLTFRGDLPCCSVAGHTITNGKERISIPALKLGESLLCEGLAGRAISILRPNGVLMLTIEQKGV